MFSFFKKKKTNVPKWANFFTPEEYSIFDKAVKKFLVKESIKYVQSEGVLHVRDFGERKKKVQLGLLNIAQTCKSNEPEDYEQLIENHFSIMFRNFQQEELFEEESKDFSKIEDLLGIRIHDKNYVDQFPGLSILDQVSEDLFAMLVYDLPDSVINVRPEDAKHWDISKEELMLLARKNSRHKYPAEVHKETGAGGVEFYYISANHFFSANIMLDLEIRPDLMGSKGALVGVPHRHAVLIYPIENMEVVKAINIFIPAIIGMHHEGPGSLSDKLYWFYDGKLDEIPFELKGQSLEIRPKEEFQTILALMADEGTGT